ncbi:MAG: hypothetical protein A2268_14330 [Candidatus Raymondbacteria bacterium RifOxyA12_full_50_37]|nr:MAG: hypothetical protein A2268_14330 [Candidatus Raymondbacteria bacterium RifOxyA12_full_50_37]OGJ86935.1 MAG: hypothetical protein A2350_02245 [Candidatus Raymondbacteria bacterium RifOxyB12_full_50_8]OGJ88257.1 MAG: hypothetical protein A2248_19670 [Candidatus Raymondbacteria bacterium RIFOXYA2_FULL_49_16]OGP41071.1 MAG: hypothetical protein A2324_06295 [Candidatus Raymondbacteria bacterium RIFOXYB2_FULL_49_35]
MKRPFGKTYALIGALLIAALFALSCAGAGKKGEAQPAASQAPAPQAKTVAGDSLGIDSLTIGKLSKATQLLLRAVDNYVEILPNSKRSSEVIMLKGHTFYNNKLFPYARAAYQRVVRDYKASIDVPEAIKMTAQTYYEESKFDEAEVWYKKLKDVAVTGEDKEEADLRLSESYYRIAERHRDGGQIDMAISEFERVVREYPSCKLADVALFNVGQLYDGKKSWSNAILSFNKLIASYPQSEYIEQALFNTAKCYEEMGNWSKAALTYIEVFKRFPNSKHVKEALYNAGLAYEKEENWTLAASVFEKYATVWPNEKDAPDVLFRAGELFGKLEDWKKVEEINTLFSKRYGQDKDRIIMVLCMTGVASYMQKKYERALQEFEKAIKAGADVGLDKQVNAFYAAKSQFTIGQINQERAAAIELTLPENEYKRKLKDKVAYTEAAVNAYTRVSTYKLIEWTTQSIFKIGETYEQFGIAMYRRERPMTISFDKMVALEEGIAKVVEEYLVDKALATHEQNVKFGIKYQIEDEWIKRSRQQLTKLPYLSAENYTKLVEIVTVSGDKRAASDPMKIIQEKLEALQNIAPFQDKAIKLFLKTLEVAARYGVEDKYKQQASSAITKISYDVGNTYAEVVNVARSAPVPPAYDGYQKFFYKVTLLTEVLGEYEEKAIQAFFKNIKIAEAYEIKDEWVVRSKEMITEILFTRSFCYEILAAEALKYPPIPVGASEEEAEEYKLQFEELGFKLQDEAFGMYRDILEKNKQGITTGKNVDLCYVRLYKNFPNEVGERVQRDTLVTLATGKEWLFMDSAYAGWETAGYDDGEWKNVKKAQKPDSVDLLGFSEPVSGVWGGAIREGAFVQEQELWLRRSFPVREKPSSVSLEFAATGAYDLYVNGVPVKSDSLERTRAWFRCRQRNDLTNYFLKGKNVIAAHVVNKEHSAFGFYLLCRYTDKIDEVKPKLPMEQKLLSNDEFYQLKVEYPVVPNFDYDEAIFNAKR